MSHRKLSLPLAFQWPSANIPLNLISEGEKGETHRHKYILIQPRVGLPSFFKLDIRIMAEIDPGEECIFSVLNASHAS